MGTLPTILSKNKIPEHDLAGVIVDANGTPFSNGDKVIGYIPTATLPEANVTLKPTKLTWEEAAALPLAASTVTQALRLGGYDPVGALVDTPAPSPDNQESIFIYGGSTSMGIYAIQLTKALSLRVTASTSVRNDSFVHSIGADTFLDYTVQLIAKQLPTNPLDPLDPLFSMVFDAAGSSDTAIYVRSNAYVKKGAMYVTTGPWADSKGMLGMVERWTGAVLRPCFWEACRCRGGELHAWSCVMDTDCIPGVGSSMW
ncbi:hypothetical protein J3R82DRAFT_3382 [Butyriboletus roseoflavus]|nr:hypothetical protein J3R82DRAFT_3382 [Butyriboletus roseoflavus]